MSSYFSLPSFARAKKNKEDLEKTNPQKPVLDEENEKFLNKHIETEEAAPEAKKIPTTEITESGEEKELPKEQGQTAGSADQVVVPEAQPETGSAAQDSKNESVKEEPPKDASAENPPESAPESSPEDITDTIEATAAEAKEENAEDPPEQSPEDDAEKADASTAKAKKPKKNKGLDLPSQEDAEAATRGFNVGGTETGGPEKTTAEKRTWVSYLPSVGGKKEPKSAEKSDAESKEATVAEPKDDSKGETKDEGKEDAKDGEGEHAQRRTWAEYASSAYSALPSAPSLPASWKSSKDKDSKAEPVYNEDGTINEEETKKKQEQEVSVLLDRLNMSSINNRVFAFSGETQKIYERFALVLKDTIEGGPTAYEDMEKLMRDAGPELEKQFASMPPFVQTLVKSLPSKLGSTLGPELMAVASSKPDNDLKKRMETASHTGGASTDGASIRTADTSSKEVEVTEQEGGQKKKRKIPGLKGLVSQQGAVASILRNAVTFLRVRFPFLASTTNVVMSLAVFILMFVFWYCHKRGKEARIAREMAAGKDKEAAIEAVEEDDDIEVTDEEGVEDEEAEAGEEATEEDKKIESVVDQEDSAEAVSATAEKAKGAAADEPESIAKQEDSAEAVSEKAEEAE